MVFFCRAKFYCFDLENPFKLELKVTSLSDEKDITVTCIENLSSCTKSVLQQATTNHQEIDCYKCVKILGNRGVYFYEYKNSVACSNVMLNLPVQMTTFDNVLGFNFCDVEIISNPYKPCLNVVAHDVYQQLQCHWYRLYGLLVSKNVDGALDLCKCLTATSGIIAGTSGITASTSVVVIPANELLINEHFGNWLEEVLPSNVFVRANEPSQTNYSVFNSSREDFRLFQSGHIAHQGFIQMDGLDDAIECKMDNISSEDQMIAELHKVASDVGHQLVTAEAVPFDHLIIYGLLVKYKQSKAVIYKLHLDFEEKFAYILKSGHSCSITEGVSCLVAALVKQ